MSSFLHRLSFFGEIFLAICEEASGSWISAFALYPSLSRFYCHFLDCTLANIFTRKTYRKSKLFHKLYAMLTDASPSVSPMSSRSSQKSLNDLTRPLTPERWQWQCCVGHEHSTWPLTVTNRCLICGHRFCAGKEEKRGRSKARAKYCSSYFDYTGWEKIGRWRRTVLKGSEKISSTDGYASNSDKDDEDEERDPMERPKHWNCEIDCDFPSECRWIPKLMGTTASGIRGGGVEQGEEEGIYGPVDEDFEKDYYVQHETKLTKINLSNFPSDDADDAGYEAGDESEIEDQKPPRNGTPENDDIPLPRAGKLHNSNKGMPEAELTALSPPPSETKPGRAFWKQFIEEWDNTCESNKQNRMSAAAVEIAAKLSVDLKKSYQRKALKQKNRWNGARFRFMGYI